jgi:hypothetical protein
MKFIVEAVCVSSEQGIQKHEVDQVRRNHPCWK